MIKGELEEGGVGELMSFLLLRAVTDVNMNLNHETHSRPPTKS